jgi:P27 family predicted phage terminase small subunit
MTAEPSQPRALAPRLPPVRAPRGLSAESRTLWRALVSQYSFEPHHLQILERACESLDRLRQAQAAIAKDGAYVRDRFGGLKAHPGVAVERDSQNAFLRAVRELGLDIEAPESPRAPSRWRGT